MLQIFLYTVLFNLANPKTIIPTKRLEFGVNFLEMS